MLTLVMLRTFVSAPVMCVGGVFMAVSMDSTLSLVLVVAVPLLAVLIFIIGGKALPLFKAMQGKIDRINLILRENLSGVRVIRAFNRTGYERDRFNEANLDLTATAVRVHRMMATLMPVLMLVMNLTAVAIIWFGGIRIDAGHMQVGALMAFLQYAMQIMFSLLMASMLFVMVPGPQLQRKELMKFLIQGHPSGTARRSGTAAGAVSWNLKMLPSAIPVLKNPLSVMCPLRLNPVK